MGVPSNFFGAFAVVVLDPHPDPPVADGAAETQDFGGTVALGQVIGYFAGGFFLIKCADLDGPTSAFIERSGGLHDFDADFGDAWLPDIYFSRGGQ